MIEWPLTGFPGDFGGWSARKQMVERRRIYTKLWQHYEKLEGRGKNIPRPDLTAMKQMNAEGLVLQVQ